MIIPGPFKGASDFDERGLAAVERDDGTLDYIDARGSFKTSQHFKDWPALGFSPGVHGAWLPRTSPPADQFAQNRLERHRNDKNKSGYISLGADQRAGAHSDGIFFIPPIFGTALFRVVDNPLDVA